MDFLQRTPFFRLLLPLVISILLYQYWELPSYLSVLFFITSLLLLISSCFLRSSDLKYKYRWVFGSGVFLFMMASGYYICFRAEERSEFDNIGQEGIFLVELVKPPVEKERSYQCEVKIIQFTDSAQTVPSRGKAYIYLQKDSVVPALPIGTFLLVRTEFNVPEAAQNPDGFDYASYLKRKGIRASSYVPPGSWTAAGRNDKFSIPALADQCRSYFLSIFRRFNFEKQEFAVLAALTFGYTDELEPDLRTGYSASGAMHILAVSGLHVGIIYAVLSFIFAFLRKNRLQRSLRTILILIFLWSYAFITGLSPSVFRACLMFSFAALGALFERESLSYNTIFMSAFFMLVLNPDVLFHVGFQLSYSAVISIIYFQPRISKLIHIRSKPLRWFWNLFSVSIAAQIGTMPFSLYYFQQFPNYFLLSNIIAVPAAAIILYLAAVLLFVSAVPYISAAAAFLLNLVLKALNASVLFIQSMPFSVSTIAVNEFQAVLLIASTCFLAYYFNSKRYYALASGLLCVLLLFGTHAIIKYDTLRTQKLIVYNGGRNTHVNLIDGERNYVFTADYAEMRKIASSFWNNKKLRQPVLLPPSPFPEKNCFCFNGLKVMILYEDFSRTYTAREPLKVDYLIIGSGIKPRMKQLLECIEPRHIITDKTITNWYTNHVKEACEERNINFYSTRHDGAFILSMKK